MAKNDDNRNSEIPGQYRSKSARGVCAEKTAGSLDTTNCLGMEVTHMVSSFTASTQLDSNAQYL